MELNEAIRNIVREEFLDILDGMKTGLLVRMARATVKEATSMLDDEPEPPPPPEPENPTHSPAMAEARRARTQARAEDQAESPIKKWEPEIILRTMTADDDYSAHDLALLFGCHVSSMHGWLSGRTKPSKDYTKLIRASVDLAPEQIQERIQAATRDRK